MNDVLERALAALPTEGGVEVTGDGPLALAARERLAGRPAQERPDVVVETTGDPDAILDAIARVVDCGTVVLAGPKLGEPVLLNLYTDLHARGLRLVGVDPDA